MVKNRRDKFKLALAPFVKEYGKDMMNDFYKFWSEFNKAQTKMRFEYEKTWELPKRIARWNRLSQHKNGFTPSNIVNQPVQQPHIGIDHSNRA